ncbi:TPA: hypothetical protein ACKQDM_005631 [Pseudomonas aeruginosa]
MSKAKRLNFTVDQFESVVPYASEHGQYVRYADYAKLEAEAQALREEVAEYEALCNRQAEFLRQSIVAIRGPEPELTRWGYADLPLRVRTIVEEVVAQRARGLTISEAMFRRLCEPLLSHADYVVARNELRALLNEDKENGDHAA